MKATKVPKMSESKIGTPISYVVNTGLPDAPLLVPTQQDQGAGFFSYHGIWAPGVRLFRKLRFTTKAAIISIAFMLLFARPIGDFVERHPTVKVLALSFLIMIGLVLMADGFGQKIPKGYIYAAMAFSVFVEMINLWIRSRARNKVAPVKLHEKFERDAAGGGG